MSGWYVSEVKLHRLENGELILTSICVEDVKDAENTVSVLSYTNVNESWGEPTKVCINEEYIGYASVSSFWAIPVTENSNILSAGVLFTKPNLITKIPFIEEMKLNEIFGKSYVLEGANKSYIGNNIIFT